MPPPLPRRIQFLGLPKTVGRFRVHGQDVLSPPVGHGSKGSVYELAGSGPKTLIKASNQRDPHALAREVRHTEEARRLGLLRPVEGARTEELGEKAFLTAYEGTPVAALGRVSDAVAAEIMVQVLRQIRVLFARGMHQGDVTRKNVVLELCDFRPRGAPPVPVETRRTKLIDYGAAGEGPWHHDLLQTLRLGFELLTGDDLPMKSIRYTWLHDSLDSDLKPVLLKWLNRIRDCSSLPTEQRARVLGQWRDEMERDLLPFCRQP